MPYLSGIAYLEDDPGELGTISHEENTRFREFDIAYDDLDAFSEAILGYVERTAGGVATERGRAFKTGSALRAQGISMRARGVPSVGADGLIAWPRVLVRVQYGLSKREQPGSEDNPNQIFSDAVHETARVEMMPVREGGLIWVSDSETVTGEQAIPVVFGELTVQRRNWLPSIGASALSAANYFSSYWGKVNAGSFMGHDAETLLFGGYDATPRADFGDDPVLGYLFARRIVYDLTMIFLYKEKGWNYLYDDDPEGTGTWRKFKQAGGAYLFTATDFNLI